MMTETIVIQSDIANIPQVEERLYHFCAEYNVGRYYSAVCMAVLKAVENAIVHGNGSDPAKKVEITMGTCRGGVYVEIADQGEGFDYTRYGSLATEGVSGDGIFVMKSLSDKMTFSEGGRRVRMEFEVAGIDPADALERIAIVQHHFAMVAA